MSVAAGRPGPDHDPGLYVPHLVRIDAVVDETPDRRTLTLRFEEDELAASFDFRTGQFGEFSVFGAGECTFCIASGRRWAGLGGGLAAAASNSRGRRPPWHGLAQAARSCRERTLRGARRT